MYTTKPYWCRGGTGIVVWRKMQKPIPIAGWVIRQSTFNRRDKITFTFYYCDDQVMNEKVWGKCFSLNRWFLNLWSYVVLLEDSQTAVVILRPKIARDDLLTLSEMQGRLSGCFSVSLPATTYGGRPATGLTQYEALRWCFAGFHWSKRQSCQCCAHTWMHTV